MLRIFPLCLRDFVAKINFCKKLLISLLVNMSLAACRSRGNKNDTQIRFRQAQPDTTFLNLITLPPETLNLQKRILQIMNKM